MTGEFAIAVHALVFLNHKGKYISSEELAENICTNPVRVRKVMAKLKKNGFIATKEGTEGGYRFVLSPSEVNLQQISYAIDFQFISSGWRSGSSEMDCFIASGMADIMDSIYADLEKVCKTYLKNITIADIDHLIFKENRAVERSYYEKI